MLILVSEITYFANIDIFKHSTNILRYKTTFLQNSYNICDRKDRSRISHNGNNIKKNVI